ncbi:TetR/AcrR family transcriptional regulator [Sinosporangium siamense]|uniref:HTH tetR-type domain-containing protein n=1 Tax=Sinosporangium siamense TaxID=1367973 RepID=A0A919RC71_9ACTN|nr:TetR/AcrR family transcriptional regulator [Sinosporangium siamense]GII89804.1 hypothetical protein Ssi02_00350 [Sinosporangium siamense]
MVADANPLTFPLSATHTLTPVFDFSNRDRGPSWQVFRRRSVHRACGRPGITARGRESELSPRQSDTRHKLLDEFATQLLERGYPGISLSEIAGAVGIRKASLYHHFPDGKESLFAEVSLRYIEELHTVLREALDTPGGLGAQLSAIVAGHAADAYRSAMGMRIFDSTRYVGDDIRTQVSQRYVHALIAPVTDLMAAAVDRGELRPADPAFLASAFLELAAVAEPLPPDTALPPAQGPPNPPAVVPGVVPAVVELFLRGAAS